MGQSGHFASGDDNEIVPYLTSGLRRVTVRAKHVVGVLYSPDSPGPHPVVLVLGGSGGGVPVRSSVQLARAGFAAMAVPYFGMPGLPQQLVEIPLEYFGAVIEWLRGREEVDARRLGVLGRSRGGELALLLAATYPETIRTVVAYVPSSVVWQASLSELEATSVGTRSSWTLAGQPVPFLSMAPPTPAEQREFLEFLDGKPIAVRPFFERALLRPDAVQHAAIAVEHINGPVLVISAGCDQLWPSGELCERVMRRLSEYDRPFPRRHLHYAYAGHLVGVPATTNDARASGRLLTGGSHARDAAASNDAWPTVVAFLREGLVKPTP